MAGGMYGCVKVVWMGGGCGKGWWKVFRMAGIEGKAAAGIMRMNCDVSSVNEYGRIINI